MHVVCWHNTDKIELNCPVPHVVSFLFTLLPLSALTQLPDITLFQVYDKPALELLETTCLTAGEAGARVREVF